VVEATLAVDLVAVTVEVAGLEVVVTVEAVGDLEVVMEVWVGALVVVVVMQVGDSVVVVVVVVVVEAEVETGPLVGSFGITGHAVSETHVNLPMMERMEEVQKGVEVVAMIEIETEIVPVNEMTDRRIEIATTIEIAIMTETAKEVDIVMEEVELVYVMIFVLQEVVDLEMVASLLMNLINNGVVLNVVVRSLSGCEIFRW